MSLKAIFLVLIVACLVVSTSKADDDEPETNDTATAPEPDTAEGSNDTATAPDAAEGSNDTATGSNDTETSPGTTKAAAKVPRTTTKKPRSRTSRTTNTNSFAVTRVPDPTSPLYDCSSGGSGGGGSGNGYSCIVRTESTAAPPTTKTAYQQRDPSDPRYNNPGLIRDRNKNWRGVPYLGDAWKWRFQKGYTPASQDFCAPYHCNDYHKNVCGIHRKTVTFEWFQSGCHLILHNLCHRYRGSKQFDKVEDSFCIHHAFMSSGYFPPQLFLRTSSPEPLESQNEGICSKNCEEEDILDPICGVSSVDGHVVMFKNKCYLENRNFCNPNRKREYKIASMDYCKNVYINNKNKP